MWREYSANFIKRNRASSITVIAAAFISALFLSLLCGLFYNFWNYEIEAIVLEEGSWQGRISGTFDRDVVLDIEKFANVEKAEINEELSQGQDMVVDIYFQNMRTIYEDMPLIARQLGTGDMEVEYHELLLSRYMIHDPQDEEPPLLMAFYLAILLLLSVSLILIIHNAFALSMNARVHQFGILSSIGATPGQIRACLLQEAGALCVIPVLLGSAVGVALSFGTIQLVNVLAAEIPGRHEAVFVYHPIIFAVTILAASLTVLLSAWLPALRLSKRPPLEAIKNMGELQLKRKKNSAVLAFLFGVEGELAGNALKAQKKALRTSTLSLTLSFMGFTLMLCFFALSGISTNHTYFERYQDAWDVMVVVKDTDIIDFSLKDEILQSNVSDSLIYQKAEALCVVPETEISDEVQGLGGLEVVTGGSVSGAQGFYSIKAPIIIMDDRSFEKYCKQIGVAPEVTGSIVLNRIWDSLNSNFRYKDYIPFLLEEQDTMTLQNIEQTERAAEISVLAYAQEPPVLREEYENYALVQFMPLTLWERLAPILGNTEPDTYIRVLAKEGAALSELNGIETELEQILAQDYVFEMENRIQEKTDNDLMLKGYMLIIGALCALLALIGIANVFSNTLGFVRQRKREFARYMSLGMTPEGMGKLFCIEALVIAGRPVLITLPVTVLIVGFMIGASYLNPVEFLMEAPIIPAAVFILAIFGFVALAYYLGGRRLMKCSLAEALRSDYME